MDDHGRPLSSEECAELQLYERQARHLCKGGDRRKLLDKEIAVTRTCFEEQMCDGTGSCHQKMHAGDSLLGGKIHELKEDFAKDESQRLDNLRRSFSNMLKSRGIQRTRKTMVPAYTFTRLGELPEEIQLNIWGLAIRFEEPRIHRVLPRPFSIFHPLGGLADGSLLQRGDSTGTPVKDVVRIPLLHVCRDSRREGMKVYTLMNCMNTRISLAEFHEQYSPLARISKWYFNTLYDRFYIVGHHWSLYQSLIDLISISCTPQLLQPMQLDWVRDRLKCFLRIRHLFLDLQIYSALPPKVWAEFAKLETLSIVLCPSEANSYGDYHFPEGAEPKFVSPRPGSLYDKRIEWTVDTAQKTLKGAKESLGLRDWNIPQITATVRMAKMHSEGENTQAEDERQYEYYEESDTDDSQWYQRAREFMLHEISQYDMEHLGELYRLRTSKENRAEAKHRPDLYNRV